MRFEIACTSCMTEYDRDSPAFRCESCGSLLEVVYDYGTLELPPGFDKRRITQAKYQPFFPAKLASMNEGGTRLVRLKSRLEGGARVHLKLESENPNKSFKDRGSSVEIGRAKELGFKEVCCASTGNMGLSIARYAKVARIRCTVFISKDANKEKLGKIKKAGARLVLVNGDFNKAITAAEAFAVKRKIFLCGDYHYRKEGQKGVMFEILEQFRYRVPDYVFVPVGNATLLAAAYKALHEFRGLGAIHAYPKLVAVQSKECAPFVDSWRGKRRIEYVKPKTHADAIAVGFPTFGLEARSGIEHTEGTAVSVSDNEIEAARAALWKAGIGAEPGGAAAFAGFLSMSKKRRSDFKGRDVVVIVSGNNEREPLGIAAKHK